MENEIKKLKYKIRVLTAILSLVFPKMTLLISKQEAEEIRQALEKLKEE
ncbi:hypothetical protein AB3N59_18685 [Leptospira sp. WS92.C1]